MTLLNDVKEIKKSTIHILNYLGALFKPGFLFLRLQACADPCCLYEVVRWYMSELPGRRNSSSRRQMPRAKELFKPIMIWPYMEFI